MWDLSVINTGLIRDTSVTHPISHMWPICEPSVTHLRHIYDPSVINLRPICDKSAIRLWSMYDISVTHPKLICELPVIIYDPFSDFHVIIRSLYDSFVNLTRIHMWPIYDHLWPNYGSSETHLWSIWDPSMTHL